MPIDIDISTKRHRGRRLHRDHGVAARGGAAATLTILAGCLFWIATAWPDGAGAVVIAGILCALFSNVDTPSPLTRQVCYGTIVAVFVACFYVFVILPRVTDFVMLVAVLAPAFLMIGAIMARPAGSAFGIGIILTLPSLLGLNDRYSGEFAAFVNAAVAQIMGSLLAATMLGLVRGMGAEQSARRLVRAGWREIATRTSARAVQDTAAWTGQMLDRVGLLAPRLIALGLDPATPVLDILADARIGISVDELRRVQAHSGTHDALRCMLVLRRVRSHFAARGSEGPQRPNQKLLNTLDLVFSHFARAFEHPLRREALLALTSLRRNLAPHAPSPAVTR